jgi:hypothetical protein
MMKLRETYITLSHRDITKLFYFCRGLLEAGSLYKGKLHRIEGNYAKVYSVLDKKRDEDWWGWKIYEE